LITDCAELPSWLTALKKFHLLRKSPARPVPTLWGKSFEPTHQQLAIAFYEVASISADADGLPL